METEKDGDVIFTIPTSNTRNVLLEMGETERPELNRLGMLRGKGFTKIIWHNNMPGGLNCDVYVDRDTFNFIWKYSSFGILIAPIINAIRAFHGNGPYNFKNGKVYMIRKGKVVYSRDQ